MIQAMEWLPKVLLAAGALFCVAFTLTFWAAAALGKKADDDVSAYFEHLRHAERGENHWFSCYYCDDEVGA